MVVVDSQSVLLAAATESRRHFHKLDSLGVGIVDDVAVVEVDENPDLVAAVVAEIRVPVVAADHKSHHLIHKDIGFHFLQDYWCCLLVALHILPAVDHSNLP